MTELGIFLRKARIDLGISLRQMAAAVSISPAFLSSIETGKKDVTSDVIDSLADYMKLFGSDRTDFQVMAVRSNSELKVSLKNKTQEEVDTFALLARKISGLTEEDLGNIQSILKKSQTMEK
ncbi:helix-turn-helix domain-containing protein [Bacterioplanoides pacificum]|uniref:Helix-turn-helix domain-containing protein n=1 Tax=Bacterioplanoides pacificum TaxID=1171596 RepID=A0ABV7VNM0_9GAMM